MGQWLGLTEEARHCRDFLGISLASFSSFKREWKGTHLTVLQGFSVCVSHFGLKKFYDPDLLCIIIACELPVL